MRVLIAITAVLLPVVAWAAPEVRIEEIRMGYSGVYRPGHMVPVFVKLATANGEPVDGELRALQLDDDGEHLHWRNPAPLGGPDSQWRQVLLCPSADALGERSLSVSYGTSSGGSYRPLVSANLQDSAADGLRIMPVAPRALLNGEWVIGVIDNGPGAWGLLHRPGLLDTGEPRHVVAVPPTQVPLQWQGLDMIDVLYWGDPQPDALTDVQRQALVQWVWRGGHLIIALGSHAKELGAVGDLASILPVRVEQLALTAPLMAPLHKALGQTRGSFQGTVVRVVPRQGVHVVAREPTTSLPLLCRWAKGAGTVTVMSTTPEQAGFDRVSDRYYAGCLAGLAGMQKVATPPKGLGIKAVTEGMAGFLDSVRVGNWLVAVVILLCAVYAAIAGPGTWLLARWTKRVHLSWWWFGAVVAAATGASMLFSLFGIRGENAANTVVLDLTSGSSYGVAQGYAGVYIPAHRSPTVTLEGDPYASLTPMIDADADRFGFEGYPDPRSYEVDLAIPGTLTPYVRRTIKRLALNWRGDVGGTVTGNVEVGLTLNAAGRAIPLVTGTIANELGIDMNGAILLVASPTGDGTIYVASVGTLRSGTPTGFSISQPIVGSQLICGTLEEFHKSLGVIGASTYGRPDLDQLATFQVLSTLSHLRQPGTGFTTGLQGPVVFRRSFVRLDRCDQIHAGQALLIARADRYMPTAIRVDGDEIPVEGQTIVRVLIPAVRIAGGASASGTPAASGADAMDKPSF